MEIPLISKRQFNRIRRLLPVHKHKNLLDDRLVLSGIIYVIRNGLTWRQLPESYGNWSSIYSKFRRWSKRGVIKNVFMTLAGMLPKCCTAMIDSTYVKAQRTASCMRSDELPGELGRSRGGITTKIHLLCNDQQKPIDFIFSAGQVSDIKIAPQLVVRNKMKELLADKAYDSDRFRNLPVCRHIIACIPAKSNRKCHAPHDAKLYISGTKSKICLHAPRLEWDCVQIKQVRPYSPLVCGTDLGSVGVIGTGQATPERRMRGSGSASSRTS